MSERLKIATDPKIAWAMAMDSGVRSQMGPILEDLRNGGGIQYTVKGGEGASHGADYAPIYARIAQMERERPELAAVGHVLCHPDIERGNAWLDEAADAVHGVAVGMIPNWSDGRAWKPAKKTRVVYLVRVAMMERRLNLSNDRPAWPPERIGEMMADWYGVSITTRDWSRDWMPTWAVIHAAINQMEADAVEPVSDVIGEMIQKSRRAA